MEHVSADDNSISQNAGTPLFSVAIAGSDGGSVEGGGLYIILSKVVSLTNNLVEGNHWR